MKYILNIGMNRSLKGTIAPGGMVTRYDVETALAAAGVKLLSLEAVCMLNAESTWVCVVDAGTTTPIHNVSTALDQDCIAVGYYYYRDGATFTGTLVGPRAEDWGKFNPAFFRMPAQEV